MKKAIVAVIFLSLLFSCAAREEIKPRVVIPPPEPPPVAKPQTPAPPPPVYREIMRCSDDTRLVYNSCGIDVLPFMRPLFFDMDGDGKQELVAGSKDGALRFYKNLRTADNPIWDLVPHYFDGISAGAFASPAAADIDRDGSPEVLVGTGGFSSESGRVIIFRNSGSPSSPKWDRVKHSDIRVGNDAVPVLWDIDDDGRPDLIAGNSTGQLALFRNRTDSRGIRFEKDPSYFSGIKLGMYVVPAVTVHDNKVVVIAGNSEGRVFAAERPLHGKTRWQVRRLKLSAPNFAAPAFILSADTGGRDLVLSDGDGQLYYYANLRRDFREWKEVPDYFSGRIVAGSACAPVLRDHNGRRSLVTGNINGRMKLFDYDASTGKMPWKERAGYFADIKLQGFARGLLAVWEGEDLLIAGQQDGKLRAFARSEASAGKQWRELGSFFRGIPSIMHPAPAVFDLDGDGRWELIVGDAEGRIHGYRFGISGTGGPEWTEITGMFGNVAVGRFAAPSLFADARLIYLLVGQQDGKVKVFTADRQETGTPVFAVRDDIFGFEVGEHSSPSAVIRDGVIEVSVGAYSGELRHFACRKEMVEVKGN